jgi:hypothetical protein
MLTRIALFCCVLSVAAIAWADVESGPTVGETVPALKVHAVVGPAAGKELDYAAERKAEPTIYLLVDRKRFSRPMARFMKELDGKLGEAPQGTQIVGVWLTDDLAKTKEYLPVAQTSLNFSNTALTAVDGVASPEGWGIHPDADLTVVVAIDGKVVKRWGFVSVNDTLVPQVVETLKKK